MSKIPIHVQRSGANPRKIFYIHCPDCGSPMAFRHSSDSKFPDFYGCSKYPACKGTRQAEQVDLLCMKNFQMITDGFAVIHKTSEVGVSRRKRAEKRSAKLNPITTVLSDGSAAILVKSDHFVPAGSVVLIEGVDYSTFTFRYRGINYSTSCNQVRGISPADTFQTSDNLSELAPKTFHIVGVEGYYLTCVSVDGKVIDQLSYENVFLAGTRTDLEEVTSKEGMAEDFREFADCLFEEDSDNPARENQSIEVKPEEPETPTLKNLDLEFDCDFELDF